MARETINSLKGRNKELQKLLEKKDSENRELRTTVLILEMDKKTLESIVDKLKNELEETKTQRDQAQERSLIFQTLHEKISNRVIEKALETKTSE